MGEENKQRKDDNYVNDKMHIYHPNSIGGNGQDHVGKEDKRSAKTVLCNFTTKKLY